VRRPACPEAGASVKAPPPRGRTRARSARGNPLAEGSRLSPNPLMVLGESVSERGCRSVECSLATRTSLDRRPRTNESFPTPPPTLAPDRVSGTPHPDSEDSHGREVVYCSPIRTRILVGSLPHDKWSFEARDFFFFFLKPVGASSSLAKSCPSPSRNGESRRRPARKSIIRCPVGGGPLRVSTGSDLREPLVCADALDAFSTVATRRSVHFMRRLSLSSVAKSIRLDIGQPPPFLSPKYLERTALYSRSVPSPNAVIRSWEWLAAQKADSAHGERHELSCTTCTVPS